MLRFHQIVLRKFIFIFSILFFIVGAIVYYWSKEFYITQTRDALLSDIEIISFELKEDSNLDSLATKIKKSLNLRLTLIAEDGKVLAESYKDKTKMDNTPTTNRLMPPSFKNLLLILGAGPSGKARET